MSKVHFSNLTWLHRLCHSVLFQTGVISRSAGTLPFFFSRRGPPMLLEFRAWSRAQSIGRLNSIVSATAAVAGQPAGSEAGRRPNQDSSFAWQTDFLERANTFRINRSVENSAVLLLGQTGLSSKAGIQPASHTGKAVHVFHVRRDPTYFRGSSAADHERLLEDHAILPPM